MGSGRAAARPGYFFAFFDIVTISFAAPVIATHSGP